MGKSNSLQQQHESTARNRHHKSRREVTYDDDDDNDQDNGETLIENKLVDSDQESNASSAGRSYSSYASSVTDYQLLLFDITNRT